MVEVDPFRVVIGCGLIAFLMFGMGLWLGYRTGFVQGLATWRMDYRRMRPADVKVHKAIIAKMADKVGV